MAWLSKIFNHKCVIYVPKFTKQDRIDNIKKQGAELIVVDGDYDESVNQAMETSKKNGWIFLQDTGLENYIDPPLRIMAGYTTLIREVDEIIKGQYDFIFLQAGVGSFAGGIIHYLITNHSEEHFPKIILVEPYEVDGCMESLKEDKCVPSKGQGGTIMAGLDCMTPNCLSIPLIKYGADLLLAIDDKYTVKAMNTFYRPKDGDERVISGESGCAGLAGLIALMTEESLKHVKEEMGIGVSSKVLLVNTEGDTDTVAFNEIVINNKDYA